MGETRDRWTTPDFDSLCWHDNHVHGLGIVQGQDGEGELVLDIDHILEWLCPVGAPGRWRVAPATLTFHKVTDVRVELDYSGAGMMPFAIDDITREPIVWRGEVRSYRWTLRINWPKGTITFQGPGFTQQLRLSSFLSDHQCLAVGERG
jgi:hypothetical protein